MSYVERAFYDYLKNTMTAGARMLVERRLILFSFLLALVGVANTGLAFLYVDQGDPDIDTLKLLFLFQTSIAVGFVAAGLISPIIRLRSTIGRLIVLLVSTGGIFALGVLGESEKIDDWLIEWVPIILLFSWAFFVPLSTFAFAYGLFSNKITGSVLFLGKPSEDRRAIFWGPILLVAIAVFTASIYLMIVEGEYFIAVTGILAAILATLAALGRFTADDVFSTSIGFFFLFSVPQFVLMIVTGTGTEPVSTINYALVLFSLLFGAQSVSKTIRKRDQRLGKIATDSDDEELDLSLVDRFILKVGGEGVVLMLLGAALGYHLVQLEVFVDDPDLITISVVDTLDAPSVGWLYHLLAWTFMLGIIVFSLLLFTFSGRFRNHYTADLYRLDFLPPYEELTDFFGKMKRGEVSWGRLLGKYAKYAAVEGVKRVFRKKDKKTNE
ncbi:MAG: hypothetical protein ACFFGZ_03720 [Candidatus Thorarchaeota archaeon]